MKCKQCNQNYIQAPPESDILCINITPNMVYYAPEGVKVATEDDVGKYLVSELSLCWSCKIRALYVENEGLKDYLEECGLLDAYLEGQ